MNEWACEQTRDEWMTYQGLVGCFPDPNHPDGVGGRNLEHLRRGCEHRQELWHVLEVLSGDVIVRLDQRLRNKVNRYSRSSTREEPKIPWLWNLRKTLSLWFNVNNKTCLEGSFNCVKNAIYMTSNIVLRGSLFAIGTFFERLNIWCVCDIPLENRDIKAGGPTIEDFLPWNAGRW